MLPTTLIYVGILEADNANYSPKIPTMLSPCFSAKTFPFQPFPESVIVIFNVKMFEQPEPGQKVAKILDCPKVFPVLL